MLCLVSLDQGLLHQGLLLDVLNLRLGQLRLGVRGPLLIGRHATVQHRRRGKSLDIRGSLEQEELLVVPLASSDVAALAVLEHGVVLGTEEVSNGVAVLIRAEGHDTVDAGHEGVATSKAQRVADVDDGAAGLGGDEAELLGSGRADLQAPLLGEEECQGGDIGVLLVADLLVLERVGRDVVHHGQGGGRGAVVAVGVLVAGGAGEAHRGGETREDRLGDDVGAGDGIAEDALVGVVLEDGGELGVLALDLVSGDLWGM